MSHHATRGIGGIGNEAASIVGTRFRAAVAATVREDATLRIARRLGKRAIDMIDPLHTSTGIVGNALGATVTIHLRDSPAVGVSVSAMLAPRLVREQFRMGQLAPPVVTLVFDATTGMVGGRNGLDLTGRIFPALCAAKFIGAGGDARISRPSEAINDLALVPIGDDALERIEGGVGFADGERLAGGGIKFAVDFAGRAAGTHRIILVADALGAPLIAWVAGLDEIGAVALGRLIGVAVARLGAIAIAGAHERDILHGGEFFACDAVVVANRASIAGLDLGHDADGRGRAGETLDGTFAKRRADPGADADAGDLRASCTEVEADETIVSRTALRVSGRIRIEGPSAIGQIADDTARQQATRAGGDDLNLGHARAGGGRVETETEIAPRAGLKFFGHSQLHPLAGGGRIRSGDALEDLPPCMAYAHLLVGELQRTLGGHLGHLREVTLLVVVEAGDFAVRIGERLQRVARGAVGTAMNREGEFRTIAGFDFHPAAESHRRAFGKAGRGLPRAIGLFREEARISIGIDEAEAGLRGAVGQRQRNQIVLPRVTPVAGGAELAATGAFDGVVETGPSEPELADGPADPELGNRTAGVAVLHAKLVHPVPRAGCIVERQQLIGREREQAGELLIAPAVFIPRIWVRVRWRGVRVGGLLDWSTVGRGLGHGLGRWCFVRRCLRRGIGHGGFGHGLDRRGFGCRLWDGRRGFGVSGRGRRGFHRWWRFVGGRGHWIGATTGWCNLSRIGGVVQRVRDGTRASGARQICGPWQPIGAKRIARHVHVGKIRFACFVIIVDGAGPQHRHRTSDEIDEQRHA